MKEGRMQIPAEHAIVLALVVIILWNVFALMSQNTNSLLGVLIGAFNQESKSWEEAIFSSSETSDLLPPTVVVYTPLPVAQPDPTPTPEEPSPE